MYCSIVPIVSKNAILKKVLYQKTMMKRQIYRILNIEEYIKNIK